MKRKSKVSTPKLDTLLASGVVRLEGGEYVGLAADGVEVNLGNEYYPEQVESYLESHPDPLDW